MFRIPEVIGCRRPGSGKEGLDDLRRHASRRCSMHADAKRQAAIAQTAGLRDLSFRPVWRHSTERKFVPTSGGASTCGTWHWVQK